MNFFSFIFLIKSYIFFLYFIYSSLHTILFVYNKTTQSVFLFLIFNYFFFNKSNKWYYDLFNCWKKTQYCATEMLFTWCYLPNVTYLMLLTFMLWLQRYFTVNFVICSLSLIAIFHGNNYTKVNTINYITKINID